MLAPKRIREEKIPESLIEEKRNIGIQILSLSARNANILINAFNEKWIAAGGTFGSCLANKKEVSLSEINRRAWQIRRQAALRFQCKVSEIVWGECFRMAKVQLA